MLLFYPEINDGNIEYKSTLANMDNKKLIKYATQLKYRVLEGCGTTIYIIGISDKGSVVGLGESFDTVIYKMDLLCKNIDCSIQFIMKCYYKLDTFLIVKIVSNFNVNTLPFII